MRIPGNCGLFHGISAQEADDLFKCVDFRQISAEEGKVLIREGDSVESIWVVLSGSVRVVRSDSPGFRTIQAQFGVGEIFGETLACARMEKSPVSAIASERSELLSISYRKLIFPCGTACVAHRKIVENLIEILARRNLFLNGRLGVLSRRNTREKVLTFLAEKRASADSDSFEIPFSRAELADFLCVDRSALSRELSRLKAEGVLQFELNRFTFREIPD